MMPTQLVSKKNINIRLFDEVAAVRDTVQNKILFLKLGERIGDFVAAIDAFCIIRNAFKNAEISLICLPSIVSLAESTGLFDRVVGFPYVPDVMNEGKISNVYSDEHIAVFLKLLNGKYFLAADFRYDGSTRLWLDYVDCDFRAGFAANTSKGLDVVLPDMEWRVPFTALEKKNLPVHTEARLSLLAQSIVNALSKKTSREELFPLPKDWTENDAYRMLKTNPRMKIGVSLGAGSELRKWKKDYWINLLPRLIKTYNAHIIFFGGSADIDETKAVAAKLSPDHYTDLTDKIPLAHAPTYMKLLNAYIGCDTGPTHLAANLGLPTVDIYAGISNISVWRARGPNVKTVYAEVICAPCHLRFKEDCPNNNICMEAIAPDIVYACFEQVLANNNK
jgi:ADP-heptose:LPS heptosyltransferase